MERQLSALKQEPFLEPERQKIWNRKQECAKKLNGINGRDDRI